MPVAAGATVVAVGPASADHGYEVAEFVVESIDGRRPGATNVKWADVRVQTPMPGDADGFGGWSRWAAGRGRAAVPPSTLATRIERFTGRQRPAEWKD